MKLQLTGPLTFGQAAGIALVIVTGTAAVVVLLPLATVAVVAIFAFLAILAAIIVPAIIIAEKIGDWRIRRAKRRIVAEHDERMRKATARRTFDGG